MVMFNNKSFLFVRENPKTENTPDIVLVGGDCRKDQSAIMGVDR